MALTFLFYLGLLMFFQAEFLRSCNSCDSLVTDSNLKKDDTLLGMFYKVIIQNKQHLHACTGAILNETHVLTTVTCIFPWGARYRLEDLSIADSITKPTFTHNVTQILLHENFTYFPIITNDIALLKVTPSITLSDIIKFAKLPQANDVTNSGLAFLVGWFTPSRRKEVTSFGISRYEIVNKKDCEKRYRYGNSSACLNCDVIDTYLCAYPIDRYLFNLDLLRVYHAGGLLTVNGTLIGLLSGYNGENTDLFVMFIRVASYLTWIK